MFRKEEKTKIDSVKDFMQEVDDMLVGWVYQREHYHRSDQIHQAFQPGGGNLINNSNSNCFVNVERGWKKGWKG